MSSGFCVGGYVVGSALDSVSTADAARLTHLFVAFAVIEDGTVVYRNPTELAELLRIRAANPDLRIILSVGGWGAGGFSEAAATAEGRRAFAGSAVELVHRHGFDGIDVDWEYPCYSAAGIASSPADRENFTLLLADTRDELDRRPPGDRSDRLLTIAVGADQYFIEGTRMDQVQEVVDLVNVMTYDMRGGFQVLTGHHTCLHHSAGDLYRISAERSLDLYERAGVPRAKMAMGAAFYARTWSDVPDRNHGLFQMSGGVGRGGPGYGELEASYINRNGYTRYWDDEAKAPYLFDGSTFISYDDPESLRHKARFVRAGGYAGIFYWQHAHDPSGALLETIAEGLSSR
ncbi:MAG: glycoside hydrolase family 18 protein [Spirochaetaceae bacterium]|nr:MAG: glycoside hydrolase family 18 protein [Spirochaetaceae bacterium]